MTTEAAAPQPYALIPLTPSALKNANKITEGGAGSLSGLSRGDFRDVTIGIGDIVAVTIFEAQSGGLFIPREAGSRAGNFVDIPRQQVDQSGSINVPYAGTIKVAGLTTRAVSNVIRERIKDRAIDPQAVVSVAEQRGNQVSILGDVNSPLRFAVDPGGIRLLGAIARAGGPKNPAYETKITIKRGNRTFSQLMSNVVNRPQEDIMLTPGDVIYLVREPRVFLVFGSTPSPGSIGGTNNRRFTFENDTMSLSEAIAKAGGLDGARANSKAVYLLRAEPKKLLRAENIDVSAFPNENVPTVYQLDFSKPDGLFMADSLQIRDHDIIFVSESPSTEIIKLLNVVTPITSNVYNVNQIAR